MKDGFIKVAAATPEIKVADCKHNAKQIISLAKELGMTVVVTDHHEFSRNCASRVTPVRICSTRQRSLTVLRMRS